jgi:excisionase family DNA binding protein
MELLTIKEVAATLRLSKSQVYVLVSRREIPHVRMGKRILIPRSQLDRYIRMRTVIEEATDIFTQALDRMFPEQ